MTTDPTHGLSVQHADALWDAVAIPGPHTPSFPAQHERVCRAVAGIIAEMTAVREESPEDRAAAVRDDLLHAIDAAYANGVLGYRTPEDLLAAYDATRTPADQAELRDRIAMAIEDAPYRPDIRRAWQLADAVLAVLPEPANRATVLREAADVLDTLPSDASAFDVAEHKYKGGAAAERLRRMAEERPS
ncbi:hypothetical protein ACFC08_28735 [Streptomyces sp. NPDC056112]|uniref:hypothetical protein n=1 Tax=Streptomyces sp. NPDC056112 TaxID=3345715 RepID=UPI0035DE8829